MTPSPFYPQVHTLESDDCGPPDYDAVLDAIERGVWPGRQYGEDE